jgi:hypothetical protein
MEYERNSVIPTPQNGDDEILVSFKGEKGRLRNVTIKDQAIAAEFDAYDKELADLAEEYSDKRKAIEDKRAAIEDKAFAAAEELLAQEEQEKNAAQTE